MQGDLIHSLILLTVSRLTKGLLHTLGVAWNRYPSIRQYLPRKERHCRTATFILLRFEIWLNLVPSLTVRWHCLRK